MTDYELVRAYAERGDREAIGALIGRYVDVVYGSALRQVRSKQVAEDVTQGVFLLLLQKAGRLWGGGEGGVVAAAGDVLCVSAGGAGSATKGVSRAEGGRGAAGGGGE